MRMRVNREARAAHALQRRARTRARLLDAAVEVIARQGPEGVPIEEFANAAGVSRGTFYNYFPTVGDLLSALAQRIATEIDATFEHPEPDDPAAALASFLQRVWTALARDPLKGWVAARLETAGVARAANWEARFRRIHARGVARGRFRAVDVRAAVHLTFGGFRTALRDLHFGEVGPEHGAPLVTLLLVAFGVPPDEAEALSRREAAADVGAACQGRGSGEHTPPS
jgi:AcrR family transcriptional regulator